MVGTLAAIKAKDGCAHAVGSTESIVSQCLPCLANTDTTKYNPLQPSEMPPHVWHEIGIDHSNNLTSETAIKALRKVFRTKGVPCVLKSKRNELQTQKNNATMAPRQCHV